MGKHRKPERRRASYISTGVALEVAVLFAFAYATDSHVTTDSFLAATTSIFVDGTKSLTGSDAGDSPFRMQDSFQGKYGTSENKVFIDYPRSLGPLTGPGDPTYDASEADATRKIVDAVKAARNDPTNAPDAKIYVVGYSQGAGAASVAMAELERQGYTDNVEFVLAANPRRNDGGILTRLPMGVYLPVFGVTFGQGTSPQSPDTKVLQVTKQYDGVGDAPTTSSTSSPTSTPSSATTTCTRVTTRTSTRTTRPRSGPPARTAGSPTSSSPPNLASCR